MLVLPIYLTLLDKSEGGFISTARADILETVQDLLILTVLLEEKKTAWKRAGETKDSPVKIFPPTTLLSQNHSFLCMCMCACISCVCVCVCVPSPFIFFAYS
jgi:hypothetical protein